MWLTTLGAEHPQVAIARFDIGRLRAAQGDQKGAEALYRQALPVIEKSAGPQSAEVAEVLENVGERVTGVLLDDGMVYWYARPSAKFPTVEIRIADVPATTAETVLLAVLARALVITSLGEIRSGAAEPAISEPVLRARYWLAARDGLHAPVLAELVDHIAPALHHTDELAYASAELDRIRRCGNGAERQRRAWARRGEVVDVLAEVTAATVIDPTARCRTAAINQASRMTVRTMGVMRGRRQRGSGASARRAGSR